MKIRSLKMVSILKYTLRHDNALKPQRINKKSVGHKLFAVEDVTIPPSDIRLLDTGVALEMLGLYYGQIENMPENYKFKILAGVIDPNYRGTIKIALYNQTNEEQTIRIHDVIAQIIFLPVKLPELVYNEDEEETEEKVQDYVIFTKTYPSAIKPTRFDKGSVGYDLHSLNNICVPPLKTVKVDTGITLYIKGSYYAQIRNKSGFSTKKKLNVINGVIDASLKSSIHIEFENLSNEEQHIFAEEKIAQIIFLPVVLPDMIYRETIDMDTERGECGFTSGEMIKKCSYMM